MVEPMQRGFRGIDMRIGKSETASQPIRSHGAKHGLRGAGWYWALAPLFLVSSPARAGPPFVTDDPEPVDYQHWEYYIYSMGTRASGGTSGVVPALEFDYGIVPNGRLAIVAPMAFDRAVGTPLNYMATRSWSSNIGSSSKTSKAGGLMSP
jgi:hypothetical protein